VSAARRGNLAAASAPPSPRPERSRRKPVIYVGTSGRDTTLRGPVRALHPAIRAAGAHWTYEPLLHAYRVPTIGVDAVVDVLCSAGYRIKDETSR
jgi:hypothetical protein